MRGKGVLGADRSFQGMIHLDGFPGVSTAPVQGSFTNQRLQLSVGSAQQATNTLSSADRAFAEAAKDLVFTADVKGVRIEGKFSGPKGLAGTWEGWWTLHRRSRPKLTSSSVQE